MSSSGKTTLAKLLLKRLPDYYHYSIDDFDLVIERMEDRDNNRLISVETEYFFHRTIAMFSDKAVNLIIEHVIHDEFTRTDCKAILSGYPILFVGVHCPATELERREKERGDRRIGLSNSQLDFVHKEETYAILKLIRSPMDWKMVLKELYRGYKKNIFQQCGHKPKYR